MSETRLSLDDKLKAGELKLKEAELTRIQSDIERNHEEKLRIKIERREAERIFNQPWYRKPKSFQFIVAGIVAIPLFWFYVKEFAIPLMQSQNIKLAREIEEVRSKLALTIAEYDNDLQNKLQDIRNEKKEQENQYLAQLTDTQQQLQELESINRSLALQLENLSQNQNLADNERTNYRSQYDNLNKGFREITKLTSEKSNQVNFLLQKQSFSESVITLAARNSIMISSIDFSDTTSTAIITVELKSFQDKDRLDPFSMEVQKLPWANDYGVDIKAAKRSILEVLGENIHAFMTSG